MLAAQGRERGLPSGPGPPLCFTVQSRREASWLTGTFKAVDRISLGGIRNTSLVLQGAPHFLVTSVSNPHMNPEGKAIKAS